MLWLEVVVFRVGLSFVRSCVFFFGFAFRVLAGVVCCLVFLCYCGVCLGGFGAFRWLLYDGTLLGFAVVFVFWWLVEVVLPFYSCLCLAWFFCRIACGLCS